MSDENIFKDESQIYIKEKRVSQLICPEWAKSLLADILPLVDIKKMNEGLVVISPFEDQNVISSVDSSYSFDDIAQRLKEFQVSSILIKAFQKPDEKEKSITELGSSGFVKVSPHLPAVGKQKKHPKFEEAVAISLSKNQYPSVEWVSDLPNWTEWRDNYGANLCQWLFYHKKDDFSDHLELVEKFIEGGGDVSEKHHGGRDLAESVCMLSFQEISLSRKERILERLHYAGSDWLENPMATQMFLQQAGYLPTTGPTMRENAEHWLGEFKARIQKEKLTNTYGDAQVRKRPVL